MARRRKYQRGHLFKRGTRTKVWVGRWWEDAVAGNGSFTRTYRSEVLGTVAQLPTRRDAEQVLAARLRRVNSGEYRPQSSCTFGEFVRDSWLPDVLPALKFSSQKHYQYIVRVHLMPAFEGTQLRMISRDDVRSFLAAKSRSRLSWKTVKHIRGVLGAALSAAEGWDLISANPVRQVRMPRRGQIAERPSISPEVIRKLLEALPEPSHSIASLLVLTGLRSGELLALRWCDVDLGSGFVNVRRTVYEGHFDEPKTRRSKRVVPLGPGGVQILQKRKPANAKPDDLVFQSRTGGPLSRRNLLHRQLTPAAKALGLAGINWHWLRHANATLHDSIGTPLGTLQALLGHSSPEITREVYVHSVPADARAAAQKLEALLIEPKQTQIVKIEKLGSTLIQ